MPPQKNLSRGCLSNWCNADADADSSKTICRPPPYGGVDIISEDLYIGLIMQVVPLKFRASLPEYKQQICVSTLLEMLLYFARLQIGNLFPLYVPVMPSI